MMSCTLWTDQPQPAACRNDVPTVIFTRGDQGNPMALTADDILGNPAVGPCVRRLAQALLMIHDASPRLASLFGTRQRWLMAHAAVAQYFRDVAAAGPGAGL